MKTSAATIVAMLALAACGAPSDADVATSLRDQGVAVVDAADDVAGALDDPDLTFTGGPRQQSGTPAYSVTFSASAVWTPDTGSQEARIADAGRRVASVGWTVQQRDRRLIVLARDDLTIVLAPSPRRGSEGVGIQIVGDEIDASKTYVNTKLPITGSRLRP